ncbi:hypothetical protein CgunFtcFv8_018154 [Champsocephalus gunnari]|uniref:Integrase catalytic domain-containing protein n=1 Tax=Champsocephalus gunnari TaxID=52237 RepID=A0AAN8DPN8_CHAGU|nr:hypothetical protein CgunFtcFv8_018154 [Champsocephalus gunnari]
MESFYTEIKHYVLNGGYHNLTIAAEKPDKRKALIRRASKQYLIKAGDLYYTYKDNERMVDESPRCQQHEVIKTVAPVLHPIHVPEAWTALGVDLIGPLPSTAKGKRYILTATDLFTKWVVATTLYHKTAAEVSKKIVNILLDFGLVEKIITDQGREFVNEVHRGVFDALGVKHCITLAYRPQCNGQDERTVERTRMTRTPEGIVASISTSKQRSTKCTPYFAQFGRHPRVPGVIHATLDDGDDTSVLVPLMRQNSSLRQRLQPLQICTRR